MPPKSYLLKGRMCSRGVGHTADESQVVWPYNGLVVPQSAVCIRRSQDCGSSGVQT